MNQRNYLITKHSIKLVLSEISNDSISNIKHTRSSLRSSQGKGQDQDQGQGQGQSICFRDNNFVRASAESCLKLSFRSKWIR